ncbi:di-heme oxidoredictase family protein [Myxococcus stipitatus]
MEAILWHGGEAHAAKEAVRALPGAEREALLAFLGSL